MEQCKLSKTSNGEDLGEVDVKRKIFHHFCLFWVWYICRWYLERWMQAINGEKIIQAESFIVHGWFEAVFQEW